MKKYLFFCLALAVALLQSSMAAATHYVLLTNGRLCVFPDSCLRQWGYQNGNLVFTALDGSRYSYQSLNVVSCDKEPPRQLPAITSFKFNNEYNYQLIGDAVGVIDGDVITA